jgi:hypothetical protein
MIRSSRVRAPSAPRRARVARLGLGVIGATGATGALAQSATQTLAVAFTGLSIPIGGWTAVGIAVLLALAGGVLLHRRARTGASAVVAALLATGALLTLPPTKSAEAIVVATPLNLITSPATLSITFPAASSLVLVTNDTGVAVTITSVTLTPAGAYVLLPAPTCTIGLVLAPGATCNIFLAQPA